MQAPTIVTAQPGVDAKGGRVLSLDVLRGVAILLVMGRHHFINPRDAGLMFVPAAVWHRYGWTGVDLFFVLSGFLVGGLLLKETLERGELHVPRFLVRREFKIWPSYYVFLIWVAIKTVITSPEPARQALASFWPKLWPCLANIQNYFDTPRLHLWSLAVEEHFYLVLPLVVKWLAPNPAALRRLTLPWVLGGVFVASLSLRGWVALTQPPSNMYMYYTHLRLDSLAFGFLLAYVYYTRRDDWNRIARHRRWLIAGGLLAVAPSGVLLPESAFEFSAGLTLLYLGYGALLVACVSATEPASLTARAIHSAPGRALGFVGFYSYSIYLWHVDLDWPLGAALRNGWSFPSSTLTWIVGTAVYAALAVLVGVAMAKLVELPTLRLRDRIYPRRTRAMDVSAG